MAGKKDLERLRRRRRRKQRIIRATVHLFVWLGMAVLYYVGFSVFFDTPFEYQMKHSTDRLRREYEALSARYDSLSTVLGNIHPFYKTLQSHQGVDYTIPEGSRVFATADGVVRDAAQRNSTQGQTVVIDHGNGYETSYSHLSKINVRKGQTVRRGDIIALSGDTGLSLAPHLHYEVRLDGMRVDPIHYFFMELTPTEYQRLMRIAQTGMQSFD